MSHLGQPIQSASYGRQAKITTDCSPVVDVKAIFAKNRFELF